MSWRVVRAMVGVLVLTGLLAPASLVAGSPQALAQQGSAAPTPQIHDLALAPAGVLHGVLVDRQGMAMAGLPVSVARGADQVAVVHTDAQGRFAVSGLKGGLYVIRGGSHVGMYRLWTANTAPPTARAQVLIVGDDMVVRGSPREWFRGLPPSCKAAVVGGVVTAIALPILLSDDRVDLPFSP